MMTSHHHKPSTLTALALALALGFLPPVHAKTRIKTSEPVTLNFVNAEIEAVARTMATITGRNVVVDPRVKGTINLSTDQPLSPAAALNQFAATLRLQGFSLVDANGLYKIVPDTDAKLQGSVIDAKTAPSLSTSNQVVTQIFRLNHEAANNLVPVLRPLIGPNNTINVNPGNNSLIITDYADNLQRLAQIIEALDVAGATDVEIIKLQHAIASELVMLINRLIEPGNAAGGQADPSYKTTLMAEPRSNSLILRAANRARVALVRSLVQRLDRPASARAGGNIYVVHLKNADAVSMAMTLRAAIAGEIDTATAPAGSSAPTRPVNNNMPNSTPSTAPVAGAAQPSTGGQIQADPATNSLIISAPEPQYRQLRAVIEALDTRRAQVYVESLIAEVNADKASEFGIQWQGAKEGTNLVGLLGTNFGSGGANILNLALQAGSAPTLPPAGLNLGIARRNDKGPVLGVIARFLQQNGDGNILSTPNLLTLDNEEAKIVIGQNVPFVTGKFTNTGSEGSVNPFQTIERKDVGLTLRVKPQISENGTIKMVIFQEVSNVSPQSVNSATGLITNKRTIESTVLVDDGAIVVLGGLLQDEYSGNEDKVPGLGDVPFLGALFKSEVRKQKKTNLMVFLRPVVLRDTDQTNNLTLDRYDLMRLIQKDSQPKNSPVLDINYSPVMPPLRPSSSLSTQSYERMRSAQKNSTPAQSVDSGRDRATPPTPAAHEH